MIHSDEKVIQISHEIDEFLFAMCENNQMAFLEVAALAVARLAHISRETNDEIALIKLMQMAEYLITQQEQKSKENPSVH